MNSKPRKTIKAANIFVWPAVASVQECLKEKSQTDMDYNHEISCTSVGVWPQNEYRVVFSRFLHNQWTKKTEWKHIVVGVRGGKWK